MYMEIILLYIRTYSTVVKIMSAISQFLHTLLTAPSAIATHQPLYFLQLLSSHACQDRLSFTHETHSA